MDVKFVVLHRVVLHRPLLHGSLSRRNARSSIGVERLLRLPFDIHKELVRLVLVEEYHAPDGNRRLRQATEAFLVVIQRSEVADAVIFWWFVVVPASKHLDVKYGPGRVIVSVNS